MERKLYKVLPNGAKIWDYGVMKGGDRDVDKTVRLMKKYGTEDSHDEAIMKIASGIKSKYKNDIDQMRAAYDFVVKNITYKSDGKHEFVTSPRHLLWLRTGDCDCMTTAVFALLLALGFRDLYAKVIAWRPDKTKKDEFTHVYAMALIPSLGKVIPLDPVMEKFGFGNEKQPVKRTKIYRIA